jgi:uncharacterized protein YcnI
MRRALFVFVFAFLAVAAPAFAHVSVTPTEVARGGFATLVFAVPNEEDNANTVKVEIFWPDDVSFTTVETGAPAGWTATKSDKSVTWSGELSGEEEVALPMTFGPFPNEGESVVFKVLQTYDNGEIVRWIDVPAGTAEPPHPAPVVKLTGVAPTTTTTDAPTTTIAPESDDGESNLLAVILVLVATFFAALGAGVGIGVWRRRAS